MSNEYVYNDVNEIIGSNDGSKNKKRKLRVSDLVAYLLCLVVSFGIWVYVVNLESENYEYTFTNVVVSLDGANELKNEHNLSIISGFDEEVNITVVGSRREIQKYTSGDIFAHVDLGSINTADRHSLDVLVDLPDNIKLVSSEPAKINVFVDETTTKTVDLKVDLLYNVATDLTIHEPQPSVDSITVTGPRSLLDTIHTAKVVYDIGTVTTSVNFNSRVALYDVDDNEIVNPYLKTDISDVMVMVPVTMEREIPLVARYEANDTDRFEYAVTFQPQTVIVTGDPRVVSVMLSVEVNVGNITNSPGGSVTTANNLILPDNTELLDKSIKTVSYTVNKTQIEK